MTDITSTKKTVDYLQDDFSTPSDQFLDSPGRTATSSLRCVDQDTAPAIPDGRPRGYSTPRRYSQGRGRGGRPSFSFPGFDSRSRSISVSSGNGRSGSHIFEDPDWDPCGLCVGGIGIVKSADVCAEGPVESIPTNRMGPTRKYPMRVLAVEHPAVVLDHWTESDGKVLVRIAGITSFRNVPLEDYIESVRLYNTPDEQYKGHIKFANTIPIYHPFEKSSAHYLGKTEFLFTTNKSLSKQSYVALEGYHVIPLHYLRAFGERSPNCSDVRLDYDSYKLLLAKLGLPPRYYESLDDIRDRVELRGDLLCDPVTTRACDNSEEATMEQTITEDDADQIRKENYGTHKRRNLEAVAKEPNNEGLLRRLQIPRFLAPHSGDVQREQQIIPAHSEEMNLPFREKVFNPLADAFLPRTALSRTSPLCSNRSSTSSLLSEPANPISQKSAPLGLDNSSKAAHLLEASEEQVTSHNDFE